MQSTEPNCRTKAVNCFFSKPLLFIRPIKQLIWYSKSISLHRGGNNNSALRDIHLSLEWNCPLIWTLPEYESSVRFDPKDENHLLLGPYIQVIKDYLFEPQGRLFLGIVKMGWKGKKDHNYRPNWLNIIVRFHQPGDRFVCLMAACAYSLSTLSHASGFFTDLLGWSTLHCFFAWFVLTCGASKSILWGLALQCLILLVVLGSFLFSCYQACFPSSYFRNSHIAAKPSEKFRFLCRMTPIYRAFVQPQVISLFYPL